MKKIVRVYNSVFQFTEYLNNSNPSKIWKGHKRDSETGTKQFTGTASFDEAQRLFAYGDRESFELIKRTASKSQLRGTGEFVRRTTKLAVVGFMPNVSAYVAGSPRCMITRTKETRTSNRVVNVLYNPATPWNTPQEKIVEQGIKVLQFVNETEKKGYRVNLYASMFSRAGEDYIGVLVRIKAAEQMLDLLKTAYPIVNSSFFRRHCFRFLEVEQELTSREWPEGYGYSIRPWERVKEVLQDSRIKVDYYWNINEMVEVKA